MPPPADQTSTAARCGGQRDQKKRAMAKTQKSRKDFKPIEDALLVEQESLTRQIAEIEARYSDENANQARTADEGEPETITTDRERDLSLLENARDLLDQVERALRKIADGTYGRARTAARRSRPPDSKRSRMRACASHASERKNATRAVRATDRRLDARVRLGRRARRVVIGLDHLTKYLVVAVAGRGGVTSDRGRHPAAVPLPQLGRGVRLPEGARRDPRPRRDGRGRRVRR